jgi:NTE family protein
MPDSVEITDFTEDEDVIRAIERLNRNFVRKGKYVSDAVDDQGTQYVDLVLEGGGVLGIALVGYTYALEQAGLRVLSVGGTSAGAINAMMIAAADVPSEAKSERLLQILADLDMFSFVDGKDDDDDDATDFAKAMIRGMGPIKMVWFGGQVLDNIHDHLGLNRGDTFHSWMKKQLRSFGVQSVADLGKRIRTLPASLRNLDTGERLTPARANPRIAIVAADISTETKVDFPRMAGLYYKEPAKANPADFVRASMSIPVFFFPFRLTSLPRGRAAVLRWNRLAGYAGKLPREVLFADGGIMSNFPINLFHKAGMPSRPTLGVKLGIDRSKPQKIEKPFEYLGALFDSSRHSADYDFIARNPDYKQLVTYIDTGKHNWLDFFMDTTAKVDLFRRGVEAAVDFLLKFDWDGYKKLRAGET